MTDVNKSYRKSIKALGKFVNGSINSTVKNRIETLIDGNGNSWSSRAGKVGILKLHYERLGSELDKESFNDS